MMESKVWIVLFTLPSFLMVWILFKTSIGAKAPKWLFFFFALVIAVIVNPIVSHVGYEFLFELAGPDWLNLYQGNLGYPDPIDGPGIEWSVYGGLLGVTLAIHVHFISQKQLLRKFEIAAIAMALFIAGVLWLAFYSDRDICASGVPQVMDMDWERRNSGTLLFRVNGEIKSDVFNEAIKQLERRNFSVCYTYLDPDGRNNARPCVNSCGVSTSLQEGRIVAERVGLSRDDGQEVKFWRANVILGFVSAEGATNVVGRWRFSFRKARTDWDGDLDRAEGPNRFVRTQAIRAEVNQNFGNDVRQELKDN